MKDNIIDTISKKNYIKRYVFLTLGLLISAINYNLFVLPLGIVCGGTSGVATILNYLSNLDPSLVVFFQSCILKYPNEISSRTRWLCRHKLIKLLVLNFSH